MAQIVYHTIQRKADVESLLVKLNILYGLHNLYSLGEPVKMMGTHRVYHLRCPGRDLTLKIEGPQEAIYEFIGQMNKKIKEVKR
jgi:hypothetical protein